MADPIGAPRPVTVDQARAILAETARRDGQNDSLSVDEMGEEIAERTVQGAMGPLLRGADPNSPETRAEIHDHMAARAFLRAMRDDLFPGGPNGNPTVSLDAAFARVPHVGVPIMHDPARRLPPNPAGTPAPRRE